MSEARTDIYVKIYTVNPTWAHSQNLEAVAEALT